MFGNALRMGIGIGLATLLSAASSHAQLSRTTTAAARHEMSKALE